MNYFFRNKIHLSLLSALGAAMWPLYFGVAVNVWCIVVVFLLTLSIYQYNRLTDDVEDAINDPDNLTRAQASSFYSLYFLYWRLRSLFRRSSVGLRF
jgi:4-hydroxybenzoate polyprenyltransferase